LEREDVEMEHDIDHVGQLEVLLDGPPLDLLDQCLHLLWVPPDDALLLPGLELPWRPSRKGWDLGLASGKRLGDIEPLALPFLDGLDEGALELVGALVLADHGASTLRQIGAAGLRLNAEDLQP
jgi:hypothetical protein